jgi:predicted ATPase
VSGEPDLFSKIIEDLTQPAKTPKSPDEIRPILEQVHEQDERDARLGLRRDRWDYKRLIGILNRRASAGDTHTLTVVSTYADFLSSRAQARRLVAERLLTFEEVMDDFFLDKRVRVDAKAGLRISTDGTVLDEFKLSSGEYQLLYLMVAALTTRRHGTVIAIDEPELSMHIAWQRKLVKNLIRCASRAAPQFVLATHSPEVATEFSDRMVELVPSVR